MTKITGRITNPKIKQAVTDIVAEVIGSKKSILITSTDEEKDSVEVTIDKHCKIVVSSQNIRVTAPNTGVNKNLGLDPLSSDPKRVAKSFPLSGSKTVADIINNLDN